MERRLQGVLSLADLNLASSNPVKGQGNSRCSLGMFYTLTLCCISVGLVYTYSAWASGVARSTGKGQCESLGLRDEWQVQTLTLFSYLWKPRTIK